VQELLIHIVKSVWKEDISGKALLNKDLKGFNLYINNPIQLYKYIIFILTPRIAAF